jgi:ATP-dependent Zn protease
MSSKRTIAIICAGLICAALVLWMSVARRGGLTTVSYSQFLERVRAGQVASVVVKPDSGAADAVFRLMDGGSARTVLPSDYRDALATMQEKRVDIEIRDAGSGAPQVLAKASPFLVLLAIWIVLLIRKFPIAA